MPSSLSPAPSQAHYLQHLLDSSRPFLRDELESVDKNLPSLVAVLRSAGAGESWHKLSNFLDHLVDIYRILKIWKAPNSVCLCGLLHSSYAISNTNLGIFDPSTDREVVRTHVGDEVERLIHLYCIVPRHHLIRHDLLFHYSDSELVEHLKLSEISLSNAMHKALFNEEEPWRKKLQALLPADGITVKHVKTSQDVPVSRRVVAVFLLMTLADFSEQYFGFQDALFENFNGRLEISGNNCAALWPGDGKPGLWLNYLSRLGALYNLIVREEEIFKEERKRVGGGAEYKHTQRDEDIELVVPPVFENCKRVLDAGEQIVARDLYWEAVCDMSKKNPEELLLRSIEKNPFVGEPHVVLGQVYLTKGMFEEAERGLTLMLEWGSSWDKRMSWKVWIAWARVLLIKAKEKSWPKTSGGIYILGLVK
ncbi:uncharacterized protein LOC126726148 [Quercus robur]|uniref:uncharacterized protein LOC126726148 n=1 Tax=Quercus robur TaxID=38942 RepID=UPI00216298DD|nr:uncharacterized protein LOC126726148 [Quercus robur]